MLRLVFLAVTSSIGTLEYFGIPKYSSALSQSVTDVILNYYVNESSTVNIIHESSNSKGEENLQDLINEVLYQVKTKTIVELEDYKNIRDNRKKSYNVIFCDSSESFEKIFLKMDSEQFDYQGIYLFVLSKRTENVYEVMAKIFESLWSRLITNANILWQPAESESEALMYTFYPYTSVYCEKTYPIKLNQYLNGEWLNEVEYYPYKMRNLFRCPIRVATFVSPPFMMIRDVNNQVEVDGIDGILLRVLSQKMNFKVELFISDQQWGNIYENGSATGNLFVFAESRHICPDLSPLTNCFRCNWNDNEERSQHDDWLLCINVNSKVAHELKLHILLVKLDLDGSAGGGNLFFGEAFETV